MVGFSLKTLRCVFLLALIAPVEAKEKPWAFRPRAKPTPPDVQRKSWIKNPIDQFILAELETRSIDPAPEADKRTLIRRLSFDLHGLPPTPKQIDQFLADRSTDAYEKLVDRLLASPRYGERWGRQWLDLVRYADSDGYKADAFRPNAWRYRDYVIGSMNADKPYGQFIREQIAGDELFADSEEAQIATGFLRNFPFEDNQKDVKRQVTEMLNDVTEVTGEAILAVGLRCARCHDHKYDPIPQRDYYRMMSFFAAIVPQQRHVLAGQTSQMKKWQRATDPLRRQMDELKQKHNGKKIATARKYFPHYLQEIYKKPKAAWTPQDMQYVHFGDPQVLKRAGNPKLKGQMQKQMGRLQQEMKKYDRLKPKMLPSMMAITDVSRFAPSTEILGKPGKTVRPGFLSVLNPADAIVHPTADSTGRRTALAKWLSAPDNPLPWRVVANRIWQHHFGVGIVSTPNDFGAQGATPTHPALLEWLAGRFLADGQRYKKMHRLMVTSATYRQASAQPASAAAQKTDPNNKLLWRQRPRRLDAEQVRDAMLAAAGQLDLKMGGPSIDGAKTPRRSVYVKNIRNNHNELLETFDSANMFASCAKRSHTTTPLQALLTMNGTWTVSQAKALAKTLEGTNRQKIAQAFRLTFGRPPAQHETARVLAFLGAKPSAVAWEDLAHVLLNANGFLYVD